MDDTRRLTLEGRVKITIGDIKLRGNWVQVWINRVETGRHRDPTGRMVRKLDQPSRTSSVVLRDGSVLVTATTTGEVTLDTGLLLDTPVQDPRLVVAERALARRLAQIAAGAAGAQQPQIGIEASPETLPVPTAEGPKGTNALPLVQPIGDVRLFAGTLEFNQGAERSEIVISRGLDLEVPANRGPIGSRLNLTARRAVLLKTRAGGSHPRGTGRRKHAGGPISKDLFGSEGWPTKPIYTPTEFGGISKPAKPWSRSGHSNAR